MRHTESFHKKENPGAFSSNLHFALSSWQTYWYTGPGVNHMRLSFAFVLPLLFFCVLASAGNPKNNQYYYGRDFIQSAAKNADLKSQLFQIVSGYHKANSGDFDDISESCSGKCYRQSAVGYKRAREFLFGDFYLVNRGADFGIKDVYCARTVYSAEFPGAKPGPNLIPDAKIINAEHTWPQSKFSPAFSGEDQKSDIHHLFPTDSEMNSKRSSFEFGEVDTDEVVLKCPEARFGSSRQNSDMVFEPPATHKGNVARALFYFSVRYKMEISREQEEVLKRWHVADPVDSEERERNDRIFALQKNRNPFVDFPELVEKVADF